MNAVRHGTTTPGYHVSQAPHRLDTLIFEVRRNVPGEMLQAARFERLTREHFEGISALPRM